MNNENRCQMIHHGPLPVRDMALSQVKLSQLQYLCFVYYPLYTATCFQNNYVH